MLDGVEAILLMESMRSADIDNVYIRILIDLIVAAVCHRRFPTKVRPSECFALSREDAPTAWMTWLASAFGRSIKMS